ncbi:MAG: biotin/lipoyl-binding protein [Acidobacteriaceae bacterium]|nr:biotin/lipoyl-binding protein [Acidobacteriaceae bacterium]
MAVENPTNPRKFKIRVIPVLVVLATIVTGAMVIHSVDTQPRTDDAEVFSNFIGMAPLVEGPVVKLPIHDNEFVKQGELLFVIDEAPYLYALQNAKADQAALEGQIANETRHIASQGSAALAAQAAARSAQASVLQANAAIKEAQADVAHSQALVKQATAEYEYASNNYRRLQPLLAKQFVTADQVDQASTGTRAREEAVRQANAQVRLSEARLTSALAQQTQSVASLEQSRAQATQSERAINILAPLTAQRGSRASAVRNAQYNYDHCRVYAPFDARVTNLTIAVGAYAHVGQQLFLLIDTRTWWVVANYRETQLKNIRRGMHADVFLMSRANKRFNGVVDSTSYAVTLDPSVVGTVGPGLPDAQRTLNWVHLASRYPVRVRITDPVSEFMRIGANAVVIIRGSASR